MKKQYQYIGAEYTMVKVEADDQEKTKVVNGEIVESSREDEKYFTRNGFVLLGTEAWEEIEAIWEEEVVKDTAEASKNTSKKSK